MSYRDAVFGSATPAADAAARATRAAAHVHALAKAKAGLGALANALHADALTPFALSGVTANMDFKAAAELVSNAHHHAAMAVDALDALAEATAVDAYRAAAVDEYRALVAKT